jgi:hypothetical protein
MSAQDVAKISACLRNIRLREEERRARFRGGWREQSTFLLDLPGPLLYRILSYCDPLSLRSALAASR